MGVAIVLGLGGAARAQDLDALVSPGPLSRAHEELAGLRNCTSCHAPGRGIAAEKCLACHEELRERVEAQRGYHRDKRDCIRCHPEHQGKEFPLVRWSMQSFDHAETGYDLVGLHREVATCDLCHRPPNAPARNKTTSFLLGDASCTACHTDPHRGRLGSDCARCHAPENHFKDVDFDHAATRFPLAGAHRRVSCGACHVGGKWRGLAFSSCTSCHRDPHQPSLGADCRRCHDERSWKTTRFDHDRARFKLLGKHQGLACDKCHRGDGYQGVAFAECSDCHREDPHFGQFEDDCARCHVVDGFRETTFTHEKSRYPLTGKHAAVVCDKCHASETNAAFPAGRATAVRYRPLQTSCTACHADFHFGQLGAPCESCHVTDGFGPEHLHFVHDRDSRFALEGKHQGLACGRCHRTEEADFPEGRATAVRYKPLSDYCVACHENVHDEATWRKSGTVDALDCERCHTVTSFHVERFDHDRTRFRLVGAHAAATCEGCHDFAVTKGHRFLLFGAERGRDCVDCHRSPHLKGMETCVQCHGVTTWKVSV